MHISPAKRLVVEDYKAESRELVTRLAQTLNTFLDQVSAALSKQLTLTDNLKSQRFVAVLPIAASTTSFSYTLNEHPTEVRIGQVSRADGSAITAAFSLTWTYDGSKIIAVFQGLDAGKAHNITLITQV